MVILKRGCTFVIRNTKRKPFMKFIHKIISTTTIVLFSVMCTKAQSLNQQPVHETLASFKVSYKRTGIPASGQISAVPQGTMTLHQNVDVVKIHFKIVEAGANQTEIYKVSYPLNSTVVNSQDNTYVLYKHTNGVVLLSNGQALPLKPYKYILQTESASGHLSKPFELLN